MFLQIKNINDCIQLLLNYDSVECGSQEPEQLSQRIIEIIFIIL